MQLKPYRLNFKVEPGETIDSFFAHELQPFVPNAVRGEKDGSGANEETGVIEPRYQTVDHSKMVPLLTAAIQDLKREFDAYRADHP
jgi:hypothetical protein